MIITSDVEVLQTPAKSPCDRKDYKLIKLQNGLKAMLIKQRPIVKKLENETIVKDSASAVALCIDVGSFEDPLEVQGLCHFLEHMVFMGSEKFPKENEFDRYIKNRNGFDNAMTECEHTVFYFRIGEDHLEGALDRFSQFFVAPLMSVESMDREMQAVESEFQNDINCDVYRVNQLFASMVRDGHPAANFTWGNLETLKLGIDREHLHAIVHEFRKKYYKSNRMSLCIQSSMEIEKQLDLVKKYFSDIKPEYGTIFKPMSVDPFVDVFQSKFYNKIFHVKSSSKKRKIFLTFLIPTKEIGYKDKSLEYLAFLINHEGRESLLSYFKKNSLALHILAKIGSRNFEGNSMFTFFTIEVGLTRDGYENMGSVLSAIFAYLLIIKITPLEEHKEIFDEFKEIKELFFKYRQEKLSIENVQEIALNMKYLNDEDVIEGRDACMDLNEKNLTRMIERINDRRFNLMILSENYQKYDRKERWFGTEFAEIDFPMKFTRLWNERWIRKEFSLPSRNRFIPKNFDIVTEPTFNEPSHPTLLFRDEFCKFFFKSDDKFNLPYGFVNIHFRSRLTEASVHNLNMTAIYSMCVKKYLAEKLYSAAIVGYNYKLNAIESGLALRLNGFSEKLPLLVDTIIKAMMNIDSVINGSTFETYRKELKKNCYSYIVNANLFVEELRLNIVKPTHKFYFDRFKEVDKITYIEFKEFVLKFLKSLKLKVLIQGNFTRLQAMETAKIILNPLTKCNFLFQKSNQQKTFELPHGNSNLKVKSFQPNNQNSVIKNYYQIGSAGIENEALLELLIKVMREPLFNYIRTQEQLGYSVTCSSKQDDGMLGFTITVETQEKRNPTVMVDQKIEKFLKDFSQILQNMLDDDFETIKTSIIAEKRSPDVDLESEVNRNWLEIRDGKYQFDREDLEARQLELIRKDDLTTFFNHIITPENVKKLSLQIIANADDAYDSLLQHGFLHLDVVSDTQNTIKNITQFKNSLASAASLVRSL